MNSVVRQLHEQHTDVVMVDTGNSYEGLCEYLGGKYRVHVKAFLYLLTRWATALSWKQQIQNGTNFEQAKIYSSKHSAKRKNYDRGKKWF